MNLKDIAYLVGFVITLLATVTIIVTVPPQHGVQVIDCRIAEISPDIPVNAKQACRQANMERIK